MSNSIERFQNSQWKKLNELNFSKRAVLSLIRGKTVLDVGCGDGLLLEHLMNKGFSVTGIDISSAAIAIAKQRGVSCRQGDITETLPYESNAFDNVALIDVLEHVFEPGNVLREACRVSRDTVYVSVPNFVSLPARLQVLWGKVPENNTPRDGHVFWMTLDVLRSLCVDAGLEIETIVTNTWWEDVPVVRWVMRRLAVWRPSIFALSFVARARKNGSKR